MCNFKYLHSVSEDFRVHLVLLEGDTSESPLLMADCENIISDLSEFIEYIEYNLVIYIPQVENGLIQLYKERLKENDDLSANLQFEYSICIS